MPASVAATLEVGGVPQPVTFYFAELNPTECGACKRLGVFTHPEALNRKLSWFHNPKQYVYLADSTVVLACDYLRDEVAALVRASQTKRDRAVGRNQTGRIASAQREARATASTGYNGGPQGGGAGPAAHGAAGPGWQTKHGKRSRTKPAPGAPQTVKMVSAIA
jgi:hypothetical protein